MKQPAPLLARVVAVPEASGLKGAMRGVLQALAWFADAGVDDPPQAWLARWAGLTERRVRDVIPMLADAGWVECDEGRNAEGRRRRTRYAVLTAKLTEKLNGCAIPWAEEVRPWAEEIGARATRDAAGSATGNFCAPPEIRAPQPAEISAGPPEIHGGKPAEISGGGVYKERARAGARPSLAILPEFHAYAWPSEELRSKAAAVFAVCGPGLADVAGDADKLAQLFDSLADVLQGPWAQFDFRADVLIAVANRTAKPRQAAKALRLFYPLTENVIRIHDKRVEREARLAARAAAMASGRGRGEGGRAFDDTRGAGFTRDDELSRTLARIRRQAGFQRSEERDE